MFDVYIDKNRKYKADNLYQWDTHVGLNIYGLSLAKAPEIHFANKTMTEAIVKQSTMSVDGVISVEIPDIMLRSGMDVKMYICGYDVDEFRSLYELVLNVIKRVKPKDYIETDDEKIYSFNALENLVNSTVIELTNANETIRKEVENLTSSVVSDIAQNKTDITTLKNSVINFESDIENLSTTIDEHIVDKNNPHNVTCEQIGARPNTWIPTLEEMGITNIGGGINPNLLDNWHFGKPVNQRGLSEYTGNAYGIDRWKGLSAVATVTVGNNVAVSTTSALKAGYRVWGQLIENGKALTGRTITLSILVSDCNGSFTISFGSDGTSSNRVKSTAFSTAGLYSATGKIDAEITDFIAFIGKASEGDTSLKIEAIKLELGDTQTLAHQDANGNWVLNEIPNYADQLARCQRYFQIFRTETERKTYCEDFRPAMRVTDNGEVAKSTLTINGVTYYTATADL